MSNFYNQASWVLVPSGIEEDIVFAQKPISGLGDLTFTRASDATYTDSTGVVRRSPYNLFTQSVWTGGGLNVAPTGWTSNLTTGNFEPSTTTNNSVSFRFYGTAARRFLSQNYNVFVGQQYRLSVYVNSVTTPAQISSIIGQVGVSTSNLKYYVDDVEVTVGRIITGPCRIAISFDVATTGTAGFRIGGGVSANSTYDFVLSQPQVIEGTSALDYFPTTNRQDVPRIDFRNADGTLSSCGRLLLEPQRTNIALQSETFSNASWVKTNATISADVTTAPSGTLSADKLIDNAINDQHRIDQNSTSVIGTNVFSVYAKKAELSFIQLRVGLSGAYFDLNNGTIGGISGVTASIQDAGNGWYRCTIVRVSVAANEVIRINLATAVNTNNFIGNGTNGVFIWGAQLEAGAYATSYIPTTSAAVTRLADFPINSSISSLIGGTSGTWLIELDMRSTPLTGTNAVIGAAGGGKNIGIANSGNSNTFRLNVNGITDAITQNITNTFKIAISFDPSGVVCFIDGEEKSLPNTSAQIMSGLTSVSFSTGTRFEYINLHQSAFFPTRLTNAELAQLTTL